MMTLFQFLENLYRQNDNDIDSSFEKLINNKFDMGFKTELREDKEYHLLTKNMTISNMFFIAGSFNAIILIPNEVLKLHLSDVEFPLHLNDFLTIRYVVKETSIIKIDGDKVTFHEHECYLLDSRTSYTDVISPQNGITVDINLSKKWFWESFIQNVQLNILKYFIRTNVMSVSQKFKYICFRPNAGHVNSVEAIIRTILYEMVNYQAGTDFIVEGYVLRLMELLSQDMYFSMQNNNQSTEFKKKVFVSVESYISTHIRTVSVSSLEKKFHFQSNYFNRLCWQFRGMTMQQYIIFLRVVKARELIEKTNYTINEITNLVGYNNKSFFYRQFNKIVGMTPGQYKKSIR